MFKLIKNEVYKIFKQKKLYIFMGVVLAMTVLQYVGYLIMKNMKLDPNVPNPFANINGQSFPITMLSGMSTIIVIYMTILLADIVTDEYKNGTLKLSLLRPITRLKLLVSKISGLFIAILALQVFSLIVTYVLGTIFFGWGDNFLLTGMRFSATGDVVNISTSFSMMNGILFTIGSYLLVILPYMAFGMFIFFISLLYSNMGATIGTALGVWFVFSLISQLIKQVRPYIIDTYYTFYLQFVKDPDIKQIILGFTVIALYGIVFFASSVLVFRKKDILL